MSEFMIRNRVLNVSHTIGHSTILIVLIERWAYLKPFQRYKIEHFGKITIFAKNFLVSL